MKLILFFVFSAALMPWARASTDNDAFEYMLSVDYGLMVRDAVRAYDGKRYDDAFKRFQRAACAGDKESQSALGRMYLLGQGVERDDLTGYAWLKVAAEVTYQGHDALLRQLEDAMSAEQKKIATARADELVSLYGRLATMMSCRAYVPKGSHIPRGVICVPRDDGGQRVQLRRCVAGAPH